MTKVLTVLAVFGLGIALGRLLDEAPRSAEAGGGPLPPCQDINGDGSSNLTDAVSLLNWLFLGGPEPTCPPTNGEPAGLPDTGQTVCYGWGENQQRVEVPCSEAACPGQDGSFSTGCASEGRFVDNGDGSVTDNCTRLIWQKDTADVNHDGQIDDRDRCVVRSPRLLRQPALCRP